MSKTIQNWMDTEKIFQNFGKSLKEISNKKPKQILFTKIPMIDEPTGGIMENDFWVIGAETGAGKTQIASIIAENVAMQNKKVVMFALESYKNEIVDRIIWSKIKNKYFEGDINNKYINFKSWKNGEYLFTNIDKIEKEVISNINAVLKENLVVRYPENNNYTIKVFSEELKKYTELRKVDLIIIDHLHFFEHIGQDENKEITKIVKELRNSALIYNIPVVLISHLRKKDKRIATLVPDIEEFHGSSEITKHATAVITLSPAYDMTQDSKTLFTTYFRIAKERYENLGKRYIMASPFNIKKNKYENSYVIYKLINYGTEKKQLFFNELPYWVKSCKNRDSDIEERS